MGSRYRVSGRAGPMAPLSLYGRWYAEGTMAIPLQASYPVGYPVTG